MGLAHYLWMYGLTFLLSDWIVFPFNYWKNDASRWISITISCFLYSFSEFKRKNAAKKTATKERWTWEEKESSQQRQSNKNRGRKLMKTKMVLVKMINSLITCKSMRYICGSFFTNSPTWYFVMGCLCFLFLFFFPCWLEQCSNKKHYYSFCLLAQTRNTLFP